VSPSKKGSRNPKKPVSQPVAGRYAFPRLASLVGLVLLGSWSLTLLYGWTTLMPLVTPPLLVGLCLGLCCDDLREATIVGSVSGLLGTLFAYGTYAVGSLTGAFNTMPQWANKDIAGILYDQTVIPILKASAFLSTEIAKGSPLLPLVLGVVITPLACVGLVWLLKQIKAERAKLWIAAAIVVLLVGSAAYAALVSAPAYRQRVTVEPAAGQYAFDNDLNLVTFYRMRSGLGFYAAYVQAHAGDARKLYPVVDGKFKSVSASLLREPTMFYFWQAIALGGDFGRIIIWSVGLGMLTLVVLAWGLRPALGWRAIFVIPVLTPYFIVASSTFNALQPEWWATLLLLCSFALLVRKLTLPALALALTAMLFRETFGLWLLVLAVLLTLAAWRWRAPRRDAVVAWGALAAGLAFIGAHWVMGSAYVISQPAGGLIAYLTSNSGQPLDVKFFSQMFYLGFPYAVILAPLGYFGAGFGGLARLFALIPPLGMTGYWLALRESPLPRYAAVFYIAAFTLFCLIVGATGQYWGQNVIPLALAGIVALLACLDRAADVDAWKPTAILTSTDPGSAT
jgi:hypothetical protein